MRAIVVSGTGTGVGKTVVAAVLAVVGRAHGLSVAVVKAAQTGAGRRTIGDVDTVRRLSGLADVHELVRYPDPLAPAAAAERVGVEGFAADAVAEAVNALGDRDLVLVEGAGGPLVRLAADASTLADVARSLDAAVLLVVRAGLGTLHDTAATCEALDARGLRCPGIVIGAWPRQPGVAEDCNRRDLPSYAGRPLLGCVPEGAGRLGTAEFARRAPDWIATKGLL